jgi:hypothetical protein
VAKDSGIESGLMWEFSVERGGSEWMFWRKL